MIDTKQQILVTLLCVAAGATICLVAAGVIPVDPASVHAPPWVLFLAGFVFVLAGLAVSLQSRPVLVSILGNLIVAAFAAVGMWVALAGPADQFSGGLPFLSHGANVTIARWVFGSGSVLCVMMLVWGVRHTVQSLGS